jgi:hypothetical protein
VKISDISENRIFFRDNFLGAVLAQLHTNSKNLRRRKIERFNLATSFPGLSYDDEARHEKALVWAGQFCILIG